MTTRNSSCHSFTHCTAVAASCARIAVIMDTAGLAVSILLAGLISLLILGGF